MKAVQEELQISREALDPVLPQVQNGLLRLSALTSRSWPILGIRPAMGAEISSSWSDTGEAAIVVRHAELPNLFALWLSVGDDDTAPDEWVLDVQDAPLDLHPRTREACRSVLLGAVINALFYEIATVLAGCAAGAAKPSEIER